LNTFNKHLISKTWAVELLDDMKRTREEMKQIRDKMKTIDKIIQTVNKIKVSEKR
jgi:hypothetical protein